MTDTPVVIVAERAGEKETVQIAAEALAAGKVVAIPTDTVYGLAVDATNEDAVARLYAAKGRPADKPLPVLLADAEDLGSIAALPARAAFPPDRIYGRSLTAAQRLARLWPGALTLVVPLRADVPICAGVTAGLPTIGVRVPDHDLARAILRAVKFPVAVTSANPSGEREALDAQEVIDTVGNRIDVVIDGGRCSGGVPSTVVDATVDPPGILRAGALPADMVMRISMPSGRRLF
jgi:L-threonylcarbamoyladenylate synthase